MPRSYYTLLKPADTLRKVPLTLRPEPLITNDELDAFYRDDMNRVRGGYRLAILREHLRRHRESGLFYKTFLVGNRGVGKSSEISHLLRELDQEFLPVRFSVSEELNPQNFRVFDVLFLVMTRVLEETKNLVGETELNLLFTPATVKSIESFLSSHNIVEKTDLAKSAELEAGKDSTSSLLGLLGILFKAKASLKYTADREETVVQYRLQRISELVDLLNQVFNACTRAVSEKSGRQLLVVGEDFDKDLVEEKFVLETFVKYGAVFRNLQVSQIYTIPLDLLSSRTGATLPFDFVQISDVPVFDRDNVGNYEPHHGGRDALRNALQMRMDLRLIDEDARERLIVASGGNLRILFQLVSSAALRAGVTAKATITAAEAESAINDQRLRFSQRLGSSRRFEGDGPSLDERIEKLMAIYKGHAQSKIPDDTTYILIHTLAVQFFNGSDGRYGVHPIVVDLLKGMGKPVDKGGTTE